MRLPLQNGESVLETDALRAARIFGGSLDMTGAPDLSGQAILVVEDDYYIAPDTAAALRGASGQVIGPCANAEAALRSLNDETPTAAVLDVNLGSGPSFDLARLLRARKIPFVFLTGYDAGAIPEEFGQIERIEKPA